MIRMFITIEGPDGSGKSTLVKSLKNQLGNVLKNKKIVFTREPGGTDFANKIRNYLLNENMGDLEEAYLFAAARANHVRKLIIPNLRLGNIVISDRFLDSSIAYQGFGRLLGEEVVTNINKYAVENCIPDLTIFLTIDPQLGINRIKKNRVNEMNRLDNESVEFYRRVLNGYNSLALNDDRNRIVTIDASQSKESVLNEAVNVILERIKKLNI